MDEARFLHALNYCVLLPGPEAQQLATYLGWLLHRTWGGLAAGLLFVLPGASVVGILSYLYVEHQGSVPLGAVIFGLKAAVLSLVFDAVRRVSRKALHGRFHVMLAVAAFASLVFFRAPFPLVVALAALSGFLYGRGQPERPPKPAVSTPNDESLTVLDRLERDGLLEHTLPNGRRLVRVLVIGGLLWFLPILALALAFGTDSIFVRLATFFSQVAVVTFGGAYAVLTYVAQLAVHTHGWLTPGEMIDGLALAETTPGPLILVLEFVAYVGAYRDPGVLSPVAAGVLGAGITLWVTFVPCFIWIFAGAPYVEALRGRRGPSDALSGVTAAVVGVIASLSVFFGLHVIFGRVYAVDLGPLHVLVPALDSLNPFALCLSGAAVYLTFVRRWEVVKVLVFCTLASLASLALRGPWG